MPRYKFSLKLGPKTVDGGSGIELADNCAALAHAWLIGRALLSLPERGGDWAEGVLVIEGDGDEASFVLLLSDVAERRRHTSIN
jgi:hypothetical protein